MLEIKSLNKIIRNFLSREMYFSLSRKNIWILALSSQLTVFLILFIFEPFRIYEHSIEYKLLLSFSFSSIPTIVILCIGWIYIRKHRKKKIYTNGEFVVFFLVGSVIAFVTAVSLAYLIMVVMFGHHFRWPKNFTLSLAYYTIVFAIIIFFIARSLDLLTFFLQNKTKDELFFKDTNLEISSNNYYSLSIRNVLFIESERNNLRVYSFNGIETESVLIEYYTLKKIEANYGYPKTSLYRCHKSYLINISNLEYIRGNARSTVCKLKQGFIIPVSRNKRELLIEILKNRNS
jgi:hypothetical protein